jgi:hypothetical protein
MTLVAQVIKGISASKITTGIERLRGRSRSSHTYTGIIISSIEIEASVKRILLTFFIKPYFVPSKALIPRA